MLQLEKRRYFSDQNKQFVDWLTYNEYVIIEKICEQYRKMTNLPHRVKKYNFIIDIVNHLNVNNLLIKYRVVNRQVLDIKRNYKPSFGIKSLNSEVEEPRAFRIGWLKEILIDPSSKLDIDYVSFTSVLSGVEHFVTKPKIKDHSLTSRLNGVLIDLIRFKIKVAPYYKVPVYNYNINSFSKYFYENDKSKYSLITHDWKIYPMYNGVYFVIFFCEIKHKWAIYFNFDISNPLFDIDIKKHSELQTLYIDDDEFANSSRYDQLRMYYYRQIKRHLGDNFTTDDKSLVIDCCYVHALDKIVIISSRTEYGMGDSVNDVIINDNVTKIDQLKFAKVSSSLMFRSRVDDNNNNNNNNKSLIIKDDTILNGLIIPDASPHVLLGIILLDKNYTGSSNKFNINDLNQRKVQFINMHFMRAYSDIVKPYLKYTIDYSQDNYLDFIGIKKIAIFNAFKQYKLYYSSNVDELTRQKFNKSADKIFNVTDRVYQYYKIVTDDIEKNINNAYTFINHPKRELRILEKPLSRIVVYKYLKYKKNNLYSDLDSMLKDITVVNKLVNGYLHPKIYWKGRSITSSSSSGTSSDDIKDLWKDKITNLLLF